MLKRTYLEQLREGVRILATHSSGPMIACGSVARFRDSIIFTRGQFFKRQRKPDWTHFRDAPLESNPKHTQNVGLSLVVYELTVVDFNILAKWSNSCPRPWTGKEVVGGIHPAAVYDWSAAGGSLKREFIHVGCTGIGVGRSVAVRLTPYSFTRSFKYWIASTALHQS